MFHRTKTDSPNTRINCQNVMGMMWGVGALSPIGAALQNANLLTAPPLVYTAYIQV